MSPSDRPLVIAHRGASADAPENTASAFTAALEQGADWVELDVRLSSDGSLIVNHDPWYRDGRTVWSTPWSEVPEATLALAGAMDACAGMGVNVEIKNSADDLADGPWSLDVVDATVEVLLGLDPAVLDRLLISSFDFATIEAVKAQAPALATGYLVFDLSQQTNALDLAAEGGHQALHPWDPFVTQELLQDCHSRGLRVNTWTVDERARWDELAAMGVDGIVTNTPGLLVQALR